MNPIKVIIAVCSLLFFMIGFDKFFNYLQPPCSLEDSISSSIWLIFGGLQIAAGVLIWMPKFRKPVAGFFFVFMVVFTVFHLVEQTYDIGGSTFMAVLLGLLLWNPRFLGGNK